MARPLGSLQSGDTDWPVGPDSLIPWLLALIAVVLGFILGGKRMFAYDTALIATGAIAVMVDTPFGWSLLVSGVVIVLTACVMTRRFVKRHPRIEAP
jgi:TctA family transporter